MKVEFKEHGGCFAFELEPETMADAAQLARLAVNGTKEVRSISVNAYRDLTMSGTVVLGKLKNDKSNLR